MTAPEIAILTQKIKGSKFNIASYPRLEDFARAFAHAVCESVRELANRDDFELGEPVFSMTDAAAGAPVAGDDWAAFSVEARSAASKSNVCLAPAFVDALSECMLGGAFTMGQASGSPSTLQIELAGPFVESVLSQTDQHLSAGAASQAALRFAGFEGLAGEVRDYTASGAIFNTTVRLKTEDAGGLEVASLHLPASFLEHYGLLQQARNARPQAAGNEQWRADLQASVYATGIDLPVVIGTYTASLSDLSRLEVGQIIPLEDDAQNALDVRLTTKDGVISIAKGRLGAFKDHKAVKLVSEIAVSD